MGKDNRLDNAIKAARAAFPQLRYAQLIVVASQTQDPFYVTDEDLAAGLERLVKSGGTQ